MANYFYKYKRNYPKLEGLTLPAFEWAGIGGYIVGSSFAYFSPGIPPINGIIAAIVGYIVIDKILVAMGADQPAAGLSS